MDTCKNCSIEINESNHFCSHCGAKIVHERITTKSLWSSVLKAFGWESNFFKTLRNLILKPQKVCSAYINGTRKKYTNPFSFYAIITACSLFIFSQYSDQLIELTSNPNLKSTELIQDTATEKDSKAKDVKVFGYENEEEFKKGLMKFQLKYYNIFSFLFLPVYTLMAFLVFRKPFNYGEHLVINTYLQSITTLLSVFLFISSIFVGLNFFGVGIMIMPFLYYCYAYKKLYNLSFGKLLLKILKFFGLLLIILVLPILIGFISASLRN